MERLGSGVCRERWVSLERGGKSHRHRDKGRPGGELVQCRRQIFLRAGEGEGERAGFGQVGAWRVLALTVPQQQRAHSNVLSARLLRPQAVCCELGGFAWGQHHVSPSAPTECLGKGLLQQLLWQEGGLGRSASPARMKREG